MFQTLMGLIERWWKDKPRADMIRAVVRLRNAMRGCEESYARVKASDALSGPKGSASVEALRDAWTSKVEELARTIGEIEETLEIFSPELHRELKNYLNDERATIDLSGAMQSIAKGLGQDQQVDLASAAAELTSPDALKMIDIFIKENFKMEEIQAANGSNWR